MTRAALIAAAWVGVLACTGGASNHKPTKQTTTAGDAAGAGSADVKPRTDDAGGTFVRGPAVTPRDALLTWLEAQKRDGKPRLVRLPIVLKRGKTGWATAGAHIGPADDALELYLNDTALGIGLADRARTACKDQAVCAMWLEGFWRGKQDGDYTFDVIKVGSPIAANALSSASYAEVEGESGN